MSFAPTILEAIAWHVQVPHEYLLPSSRSSPVLTEFLPFIKRWEYTGYTKEQWLIAGKTTKLNGEWKYTATPLNMGDTRDIPHNAHLHASVIERFLHFPRYLRGHQPPDEPRKPAWQPKNDVYVEQYKYSLRDAGNRLNDSVKKTGHPPDQDHPKFQVVKVAGAADVDPHDRLFELKDGSYSAEESKGFEDLLKPQEVTGTR